MLRYLVLSTAMVAAATAPITADAAIIHYEFSAINPIVQSVSGDSIVAELLMASAAAPYLHGRFDYDNDPSLYGVALPISGFSGQAWGVSFAFSNAALSPYQSTDPLWYPDRTDGITIRGYPWLEGEPATFGKYTLRLVDLWHTSPSPWVDDSLLSSNPEDLALLDGAPGHLEMCFSDPDNRYSCVNIYNVSTTAVPLPGSLSLLLSATCGLAFLQRRKKSFSAAAG